jgi:hypothetical protein
MIDYTLVGKAIQHYEHEGYKRVEAPWLVTQAISDITKPPGASSYIVKKDTEEKTKTFVASGEQSFLYLINKGFLPDGKYQTVTPCLRNDTFDETHTKYFMKVELINFSTYGNIFGSLDVSRMISKAYNFFEWHAPDYSKLKIIENGNNQFDIEYNGVEIGSYGIRSCSFCQWIYGTGLAEPRFSRLMTEFV